MPIDNRLDDLLDRWEQRVPTAERPDPRDLCDDPDLLPDFLAQIEALRQIDALLSTEDVFADADDVFPTVPTHRAATENHPDLALLRTGRYQATTFHAAGGLGKLFLAYDMELSREVVLKLIKEDSIASAETRRRFELEAIITGRLEHPGVVPVYGFGCDRRPGGDEYPYYAMRFIRGERLEDAIQRFHHIAPPPDRSGARSLELQKLLRAFLSVCNTIAYAHSRGVIHRDLKPANIMLGPYGETLVVDWGLAKVIGDAPEPLGQPAEGNAATADFLATLPGMPIGTLAYMSPEQAAGDWHVVGPASDIYSLGAVLYALLTGRTAIEGKGSREMLSNAKAGHFRPPRQVNRCVPAALEAICLKAMRRQPQDRYATAMALAQDIEHWLADEPADAWREPWTHRLRRWSKRHRTILAGALTALVVAASALGLAAGLLGRKNLELQAANRQAEKDFTLAHHAVRELVDQAGGNALLQKPGMHRAQESLLRVALKYYRDFRAEHSDDPQLQAEQAAAQLAIAAIVHDVASPRDALCEYQAARDSFERLLAQRHGNPTLIQSLALVWARLAQIGNELGDIKANQAAFEQSVALYQPLLKGQPENDALRLQFANALFLQAEDRSDGELLERARRLVEVDRPDQMRLSNEAAVLLARVYNQMAFVAGQASRLVDADRWLKHAGELLARVNAATSMRPELEPLRGSMDLNRAKLAELRLDWPLARSALESARARFEKLTRQDPDMVEYRLRLATSNIEIGKLWLELRDPELVRRALTDARRELQSLVDSQLRVLDRYELGRSSLDLGGALLRAGEVEEARELFAASRRQFVFLIGLDPGRAEYHRNLAAAWNQLAAIEQLAGDTDACAEALQHARGELESVVNDHPRRPEFRSALANVYLNLARLSASQNHWPKAWEWFEKAHGLHDELARNYHDAAKYVADRDHFLLQWLATARLRLNQLADKPEATGERRDVLRQALPILKDLKQRNGLDPDLDALLVPWEQELERVPSEF